MNFFLNVHLISNLNVKLYIFRKFAYFLTKNIKIVIITIIPRKVVINIIFIFFETDFEFCLLLLQFTQFLLLKNQLYLIR